MKNFASLLFAATLGFGCAASPSTQVVTGTVSTSDAIAVRAITSGSAVTAAQVRADGSFTLSLPANATYRLELMTSTGIQPLLADSGTGFKNLSFKVCQPSDPVDMGHVGGHHHGDGGGTGPNDPNCTPDASGQCQPQPPKCDPSTGGANCPPPPPGCDPTDPTTCPPPPTCTPDPNGNCIPDKCDPSTGQPCPPPPPPPDCTDPSGNCPPPPKCDPSAPNTDPTCPPPPPPPCTDPTDPNTCQDPCMADPTACACPAEKPDCWPQPLPPSCDAAGDNCTPPGGGDGMCPDHPPGDIGCGDGSDAGPQPPKPAPGT